MMWNSYHKQLESIEYEIEYFKRARVSNLKIHNIDFKSISDGRNQFFIMGIKIIAL